MTAPSASTLGTFLRLCADADPAPWYPSQYVKATGADRDSLDEPLSQLRLAGLLRLTDWQPGTGQGYTLTEAGRAVLANPRALARLQAGDMPAAAPAAAAPASPRLTTWERGEEVREALLMPSSAPVTRLLISAQVAVFLLAMFFALERQPPIPLNEFLYQGSSPVLGWLAVSAHSLAAGEWWRLLSYGLAHGGALHLLLNVIGHAVLGPTAERMFGPVRFLALWLLSNLGGACGAVLASSTSWTVGSSGALCGLIAAEAAFVWLNRAHLSRETIVQWQRGLVGIVLLNVLFSLNPRVSWSAHLGGAVVGLIAGGLLHFQRFGTPVGRWAALLGLGVLPVACVATVYRAPGVADEMQKRREIADFNIRVVPEVQHVYRITSVVCFEHADPLVRQRPIFREADQVRSALAALATLAEEQESVGRLLAAAGPYATPQLEDARLIAEKFVQEVHELTGLYQQRLRAGGAWGREDEVRMRRFGDEAKRWGALFHEPPSGAAVQ